MIVIGRIEKVAFPDWGVEELDAKIDTGAYTSSLHCHHIELNKSENEVTFYILDPTHPEYSDRCFRSPVKHVKKVRSSNGVAEDRIIIKTQISLLGKTRGVELSLTDRSEMRNPVLLGRKFLRSRYLVDVSKTYTTDRIDPHGN